MDALLGTVSNLTSQLLEGVKPVSNEDVMDIILCAIPKSENFKITCAMEEQCSLSSFKAGLRAIADMLQHTNSPVISEMPRTFVETFKVKCFHCHRPGHWRSECHRLQSQRAKG
jgi:hypothetical protein